MPRRRCRLGRSRPRRSRPRAHHRSPHSHARRCRRRKSFEERFGTQWVVWVGGLALALGGFFLVRLSIEQGLVGPGVRVTLGALLAIAVIAAGEWARRSDRLSGIAGLPSAHIPSILTAAGTTIAYADVYAAYALYGFLSPGIAFVLLGVVALATLAAALLHGPALAGLGLVGAYVTPLLVSSGHPDYWSLYIYLAVVTAAAFALARLRLWRWLAVTAIGFALLWVLPGVHDGRVDALAAHAFHVVVGFGLAALMIVAGMLYGPPAEPGRIDAVSSGALAAFVAAAAILVLASRHDPLALAAFVALVVATCAIAWRSEAATAAVPAAAVLVAVVFAHWAANTDIVHLIAPGGPVAGFVPEPERAQFGWHLVLGIGLALLFGGAGFLAQGRSDHALVPMLWSAAAVFVPIAILVALYYRIAGFDRSIPFASVALLLAGLAAYATESLNRRAPRPGLAASGAIFATGAVAALALALTMALDKGWLTIALALMVPGIAWIAEKRPLPALRCARRAGDRAGAGADRARAAHRRRRRRHHADLQLAALRLRHSGGGVLARRPAVAAACRRCAGPHRGFGRDPVHAAALLSRDPPFHDRRRCLPRGRRARRAGAACVGLARARDRSRTLAPAHPQHGPRPRRAGGGGTSARRHRGRAGNPRESALDRRAGRRTVPQPHSARLRDAGRCSAACSRW